MKDPRDQTRFHSLWQCVVHATQPHENRLGIYEDARREMLETGRWRNYYMVVTPRGRHLGYDKGGKR